MAPRRDFDNYLSPRNSGTSCINLSTSLLVQLHFAKACTVAERPKAPITLEFHASASSRHCLFSFLFADAFIVADCPNAPITLEFHASAS